MKFPKKCPKCNCAFGEKIQYVDGRVEIPRLFVRSGLNFDSEDETRIEDRTRETLGGDFGYDDVDDFIEAKLKNLEESWKYFSMPYWKNQDYKLEVWVEKDALSRVISEALIPYGVLTAPSKGYSSYTYVKAGIDRFNKENGKKKIILHFSDHDRLDMTRDLQDRIWRYGGNIEVKRIALTYDQVKKYDLVPNPTKLADSRSK